MPCLNEYRNCIIASDVRAHTIRKNNLSAKWKAVGEKNADVASILASFQRPEGGYALTLQEIFDESNTFAKVVKVFWWGYPNGMRGNFPAAVHAFDEISTILDRHRGRNLDKGEFVALYNDLAAIVGVGFTTISKLLYFFEIRRGETKCVIIDSNVREAFSCFDDFALLHMSTPALRYLEYARQINEVNVGGATPEQIEFFLFSHRGFCQKVAEALLPVNSSFDSSN